MIDSLNGTLLNKAADCAVVSCSGVGFFVNIPTSVYAELPEAGDSVFLFTYLNVKEDGMELYGFADERQRSLFRLLTGVSGVGPKAALSILSLYDPDRVSLFIASGDYKSLTACPGIGAKIAQRLVLELKDKLGSLGGAESAAVAAADVSSGASSDAVSALVALGFSTADAASAVARLPQGLSAEDMISAALKSLASR